MDSRKEMDSRRLASWAMGPLGFRNTYSWGRHNELSFSWSEVSQRAINGLGEIRTLGTANRRYLGGAKGKKEEESRNRRRRQMLS